MRLTALIAGLGALLVQTQAQLTGKMFEKVNVYGPSWVPSASGIPTIKTLQGCSVLCVQNVDTCSAFAFENSSCSLGNAKGPIKFPDSASQANVPVIQIWKDVEAFPIPHILLINSRSIVDFSLDSSASPPVAKYPSTFPYANTLGYMTDDLKICVYGAINGVPVLLSSNFGKTSFTFSPLSIGHVNLNYGRVGKRLWVAGGTALEGTDYFQDCKYIQGPAYPSNMYPGQIRSPCVTSYDDDTGVIISGQYVKGGSWQIFPNVWSFNFTSGNWSNLANTTFLVKEFNCVRAKLASGKSVILVTGGYTDPGIVYQDKTYLYDIQNNQWSTTEFNLPSKLCCGQLVAVDVPDQVADRVFYLGGKGAVGTLTNLAYEWSESNGWTKFGTLPSLASYSDLIAMVYNYE